ncbi:MAG: sulfatase family protein [Planctomycetota bacterium]|jgi:arylsulfatase A-like enzyme
MKERQLANSQSRPNLVYVFADQLRWASLGYNGDHWARTPNIDRLAEEGVNFCNAVSGHPVCAPYRASLMTGKYTSSTGMVINTLRMNPGHECFAHVLSRGGYETAYIGKWHLWGTKRGNYYDTEYAYTPPGEYRLGFDDFWAAYNFLHNYYVAEYYGDSSKPVRVHGYEPDFQTDLAIEQIERMQAGDKPFAMFLSFGTPHDPWARINTPESDYKTFEWTEFDAEPPPNFLTAHDGHRNAWTGVGDGYAEEFPHIRRSYYAMTANLDWNMGRLMKALDHMGLQENTIVVFTSDHGEMFGAHSRSGKCTFYEEAARVPFLVRWGDGIETGAESDVCLNTPDIMPTLLGMMDLPIPEAVEGMDLSSHATGQGGDEPDGAFMQGMAEVDGWGDGDEWRAMRTKQHTYAIYRDDGTEMLFDNIADPFQMTNLIDDPGSAEIAQRLRAGLKARMVELGDTFEKATWYRENWIDENFNILRTATLNADG